MFFFLFLFSGYFRSVVPRVVNIVSGGCDQSSSTFFYVVFKSFYRCVYIVSNDSMSSFSFFSGYIYLSTSSLGYNALCIVISFLVLWSICLSSSLVHFKSVPEYLTRGTAQVFVPLIRFLLHSFVSSSFLVFLRHSFLIFSSPLICLCQLLIFPSICRFLFLRAF